MSDETIHANELERHLDPRFAGSPSVSPSDRELQDLVRLASRVSARLAPPAPRPAFTATARRRLMSRLAQRAGAARPRAMGALRRLAVATLALAVAVFGSGVGVAFAARDSLPGDRLYPVKHGYERVQLALASSPEGQVALLSEFAARRVQEVGELAARGRQADMLQALSEYEDELRLLGTYSATLTDPGRAAALAAVQERLQAHILQLMQVRLQVPPSAQPAIDLAIEKSSHGQAVIEQLELNLSPSDMAPGQLKQLTPRPQQQDGPPETRVPPGQLKH